MERLLYHGQYASGKGENQEQKPPLKKNGLHKSPLVILSDSSPGRLGGAAVIKAE